MLVVVLAILVIGAVWLSWPASWDRRVRRVHVRILDLRKLPPKPPGRPPPKTPTEMMERMLEAVDCYGSREARGSAHRVLERLKKNESEGPR